MKYLVKLAYAFMVEAASEAVAEEIVLETIGEEAPTKITITEVNEKVPFPPEELKTPQEQLSYFADESYGTLESQSLYENTGVLYDENYFDTYFDPSPKKLKKDGDTIIDIMLRTLNVKYYLCVSWIQAIDDTYKEFFVECEGKEDYLKTVISWCDNWQIKYAEEAGGIHIYDELQNDETDMVFVFLNYTDLEGNERFTWLMHDLIAGDIIVENEDLFDEIGALDINHIFYDNGAIKKNEAITKVFSNIIDCITDTKEVIF